MDKLIIKDWLINHKINYIELNEKDLVDNSPIGHEINLDQWPVYSNSIISVDHNKVECLCNVYKGHQSKNCIHHLLYQYIAQYFPIIGYGMCHVVFDYTENSVMRIPICPDMGLYQDLSLYIDHLLIPEHTATMQWCILSLNGYEYPLIIQEKLDKCGHCQLNEQKLIDWYTKDLFNDRLKLVRTIFPKFQYSYDEYLLYLIRDSQIGECPNTAVYKIFDSECHID